MRPRTIILENDNQLRALLAVLLANRGHEVHAYAYPVTCPLYHGAITCCQQKSPCCDILVVGMEMAATSGLDLLRLQAEKGCKAAVGNKILLAAGITEDQRRQATQLGCSIAAKPLQLPELLDWIAGVESRLPSERQLGTIQFFV